MKISLGGVCAAIVAFVLSSQAYATTSNVVLNLEGNPTCNSLVANDEIMEARDNSPTSGDNTVFGPDGQRFDYTVTDDSIDIWTTDGNPTLPVNFTVLKSKGNAGAVVFHFGTNGVFTDTEEDASGTLAAVSFCYGIEGDDPPEPPEEPQPMALCEDLNNSSGLDGSGIVCPTNSEQRVLISMSLEDEDDFDLQYCTCNLDTTNALPQCNPNLNRFEAPESAGEFAGLPACTNNLDGTNERVPVQILGVENPSSYICFTSGGRRVCYGHF